MKLAKLTDRYMEAKHRQLVNQLPVKLRHKYRDDLSLTRPIIVTDFLFSKRWLGLEPQRFTAKTGEPSTAATHLKLFEDHPVAGPWVQGLTEWKQAGKIFDTYIVGFLEHLRADDMFHPTYFLGKQEWEGEEAGTTTGRTSARDPAYQTIPKHNPRWTPRLRRAFPAPPGHRIVSCVAPETKICMADLTWRTAGSLRLGEKILAFDERSSAKHKQRRMAEAVVTGVIRQRVPRKRVMFDDGMEVVVSHDHRWLVIAGRRRGHYRWSQTDRLRKGARIFAPMPVYRREAGFDAGWLSGMYDGEGWLSGQRDRGFMLGVSQREGPTFQKLIALHASLGIRHAAQTQINGIRRIVVRDTFTMLEVLQRFRPERLIAKKVWLGRVPSRARWKTVMEVTDLEHGEVVALRTSAGTYFAEGLASHTLVETENRNSSSGQ